MRYKIAPLFCRPWTLNGISPRLIESHYENDYGNALSSLNAATAELEALDPATTPAALIHRLKRDEAALLNSTLLHELYFASLGGDGRTLPEPMAQAIARDFGSVKRWRDEFIALAHGLAGGPGWVLLTYVPRDARLINHTTAGHEQSLAGGIPILALDMYEHAYHLEFGANPAAYVAAFMRNIEWDTALQRYQNAVKVEPPPRLIQKQFADIPSITVEEVKGMIESGRPVQIIDTRPRHYSTRAQEIMRGAVWRDPEPVVTFCVYGFHIGCETAVTLRKVGFDARYLVGGHYAWKAIKGPLTLLDDTSSSGFGPVMQRIRPEEPLADPQLE